MSAIDFLTEASIEVVAAGGLEWQIERVANEIPSQRKGYLVMLALPKSETERVEEEDIRERHTDADGRLDAVAHQRDLQAVREARLGHALRDPQHTARLGHIRRALVRAAVIAVRAPGDVWEPVALVEERTAEDRSASPARVWQGRLTTDTVDTLFAAAWSLSTDGGAAVERLERFRGRGR
jgi:hypothetical protein